MLVPINWAPYEQKPRHICTSAYNLLYIKNLDKDMTCLLYTSEAADDLLCVDLGGRRNIKKKKH